MTPESIVKDAVKKTLKRLGVFFWMPVMNGYGRGGITDFVLVIRGRIICLETKATMYETLTPTQELFKRDVLAAGATHWIIHAQNQHELGMLLRDFTEEDELCCSNSSPPASKS